MATEYSVLPSPRKADSQEKIDAAWSAAQESGYDLQLLLGGTVLSVGIEEQLDLVHHQVMPR